jgi:hypothetical protein
MKDWAKVEQKKADIVIDCNGGESGAGLVCGQGNWNIVEHL